ncbi:hypothetical protein PGLA_07385 [Paenibacillus glacialis]|uniref:Uncharacterized protein n=1 Tax=Paenibacillus glacialis TaxID=494026 RepID=A0A168MBF6_9BACL|nr:hypothetical protein PGLA_07385 [Paenibacillus glacialis]
MSIRIKLLLSYTGMLVVSLLMLVMTAALFTIASTGDVHSLRDFYKVHYQLNPLSEQEESIFLELKYLAKHDPDELQNKDLLLEYDFKLKTERAGLFVRRASNPIFESGTFNQPELEEALPPYDLNNYQIRNTFNINERFYGYAKFDFKYSDGAKGSNRTCTFEYLFSSSNAAKVLLTPTTLEVFNRFPCLKLSNPVNNQ